MDGSGESVPVLHVAAGRLWECLGQLCQQAAMEGELGSCRHDGRAIASLRDIIAINSDRALRDAERLTRSAHVTPAYAEALALHVSQIKIYRASAPVFWRLARAVVSGSPVGAVAMINSDPWQVGDLALICLRYLHGPGRKASRQGLIPEALFAQRVRSLGGAWHFVVFALAAMLAEHARVLADIALGRHRTEEDLQQELRILEVSGPRSLLEGASELWAEAIAPRVRLLCSLDTGALGLQALDLWRQQRLVAAIHAEGRERARRSQHEARLANAEATSLRGRLDQVQQQVERLTRATVLMPTVRDPVPKSTAGGADEALLELRRLRRELEAAESRNAEQARELLILREFCGLLLEPPAAPVGLAEHGDTLDLRQARVIVVGGRDRFHQKLRRLLPRAVFLHPDRTVCPADVFEHADCVVYCIDYCSHGLALAAMALARRHSLPSGYAHHTNPALFLQQVREIIGQRQTAFQEPAVAAA